MRAAPSWSRPPNRSKAGTSCVTGWSIRSSSTGTKATSPKRTPWTRSRPGCRAQGRQACGIAFFPRFFPSNWERPRSSARRPTPDERKVTLPQACCLAIIGGMLVLFLWDRLRFDLVALLTLLTALAAGIIPVEKAFDGFKNSLLPLIASALVLSTAVRNSGLIETALRPIRPYLTSATAQVAFLVTCVAFLSAVMKNIGALAIFLPVAMQLARHAKRSMSELLMPMSFASLVGGMMTLIGTSPNLIISTVRQQILGQPYEMVDFLPVGLGLTLVAIAFLSVGWRLIPIRPGQGRTDAALRIEDYVSEAKLPATSPLVNKTVADLEALADNDVSVVAILREGNRRYVPAAHWHLYANDILVLRADPEDLHKLLTAAKLARDGQEDAASGKPPTSDSETDVETIEAVIATGSPLIGQSPASFRLRQRYDVRLVAGPRGGGPILGRPRGAVLKEGDVIGLQE